MMTPLIDRNQTDVKTWLCYDPPPEKMQTQGISQIHRYRTQNPYEQSLGYSRAVRRGNYIFVAGTTALDPQTGIVAPGLSAYDQAVLALSQICQAVESLGGRKEDVMRVRMYVTEQNDFEDVARAYSGMFGEVKPALTGLVGIKFVSSDMKVEMEADAIVA